MGSAGQPGHRTGVTERYAEYAPDFKAVATPAIEQFWQKMCGDSLGNTSMGDAANY
jgi:hypothetical protein